MNFNKIPGIWLAICGLVYCLGFVVIIVIASTPCVVGYVVGGALALLNFWISAGKLKNTEFRIRNSVMISVIGGFYLRMAILSVCLFISIVYLRVDPVGMVIGLSVIPAGIPILLLLIDRANRTSEEASVDGCKHSSANVD